MAFHLLPNLQFYGFFPPLYSLQAPSLDSIFQSVIQHFSNTRGSTNTSWHVASARTSGIPGCLGDGQMPVHVAKLWFGHVDPFLSVTLSEWPACFLPPPESQLLEGRCYDFSVTSRGEPTRNTVGAQRSLVEGANPAIQEVLN